MPFCSSPSSPDPACIPHPKQLLFCIPPIVSTLDHLKAHERISLCTYLVFCESSFQNVISFTEHCFDIHASMPSLQVRSAGFSSFVLTDSQHPFACFFFLKNPIDVRKQLLTLAYFDSTFVHRVFYSSPSQYSDFAHPMAAALSKQAISAPGAAFMQLLFDDVNWHSSLISDIGSFLGLVDVYSGRSFTFLKTLFAIPSTPF